MARVFCGVETPLLPEFPIFCTHTRFKAFLQFRREPLEEIESGNRFDAVYRDRKFLQRALKGLIGH